MKILVDLSGCTKGYSYWTYASRVLSVWREYKSSDVDIILLIREDMETLVQVEFPEFDYILLLRDIRCNRLLKISGIKWLLNGLIWKKTVNSSGCDVLFSPGTLFSSSRKVTLCRVQVIHDLIAVRGSTGKHKLGFRLFMPLILKYSNKIITISEFVRQDVVRTYPFISPDKITVIHNGVVLPVPPSLELKVDYKYLLYVSTLWKYKNVETLVKAFIKLKDVIPHKLVIVGKASFYWEKEVLPIIKNAGIEDRIIHLSHHVSDGELVRLYQSADIFISPSLEEGFGYTPIEAAICEVPVICTRETALPEVTMDMVNYYEPALDSDALKNKIMEVLENYPSKEYLKKISDCFKSRYDNTQQAMKLLDCVVGCTDGRNLVSHTQKQPLSTPFYFCIA